MKRLAICVALIGVFLICAGCKKATPEQHAAEEPARKLTIGVSVPAADHGWTAGVGWWARRAMEMYPDVNWAYATAIGPEKQIADIKDMMSQQKLDGLVILATESAPLTPIAEEAHNNKIYIVSVDRGFLKPVADLFIEGDNEAFGRKSAEFIAAKLGGKGKIVELGTHSELMQEKGVYYKMVEKEREALHIIAVGDS